MLKLRCKKFTLVLTRLILPVSLLFCFVATSNAQTYYEGLTSAVVNSAKLYEKVHAGQVLIVSEYHDYEKHHENQREILSNVAAREEFPVSVGMEFFYYPNQKFVDEYLADLIDEATFLKNIDWGKNLFSNYRYQVLLPSFFGGTTVALNMPRSITSKIVSGGLDSLTDEDKAMFPPNFTLGRESYLERFREEMKGHATEEQIRNYFTSQSLWDDTMAWKAAEFLQNNPNQMLMIIVGDFHVAYQDGLVARLKARGVQDILSISQIDSSLYPKEEKKDLIGPHPRYGVRADFIFDAAREK